MPFEKGHKLSGSRKGKPNKVTMEARELLNNVIENQVQYIEESLEAIRKEDHHKYLSVIDKLFGYVFPKRKDVTSGDKPLLPPSIIFKSPEDEPGDGSSD